MKYDVFIQNAEFFLGIELISFNRHTHTVSVKHIQDAIHKLQSAKSDCKDQLLSDHFINGTVKFFTLISLLFTCMLTHGVAPSGLLLSTMIPVPIDKRGMIMTMIMK